MTDLSREQIEYWRNRLTPDAIKQNASLAIHDLCDMALRTHDAEAECERLREVLSAIYEGADDPQYEAGEALATPPPEGEPQEVGHSPTREYGTDDMGAVYSDPRNPVNAPHTPQAHGDALAAFERLCNWYSVPGDEYGNDDIRDPDAARSDVEIVRQALTASGVPERGDVSLDQYEKVRRERDNLAAAIRSMPIPELPHKTAMQLVEAFDRYEEKRGPGTLGWRAESMQAAWCLVQRSPAAWG